MSAPSTTLSNDLIERESKAIPWPIWQPTLVVVLASIVINVLDLDRAVSRPWYDTARHLWPLERTQPFYYFYLYGVYPPLFLGLAGLLAACFGSVIWRKADPLTQKQRRLAGLFLALMLAIGPGLLVNGVFKSYWGRPRPIQCEDFGGELEFRPVGDWQPQANFMTSFPSGHASTAFFLIGPGFLFSRYRSWKCRSWFLAGSVYGCAMGFNRIMQGGHFLSDVLWAGLIVYLVGAVLSRWLVEYE